jgi:hypothetical protein
MTEQDEDSLLHGLRNPGSAVAAHEEDTDLTDEIQDFRFLSTLSQYIFPVRKRPPLFQTSPSGSRANESPSGFPSR